MNDTTVETVRPPLLDRQASVLERHSIYIDRLAVGTVYHDRLLYGIDDAAKLVRVLQALPLCSFFCVDVHHGDYNRLLQLRKCHWSFFSSAYSDSKIGNRDLPRPIE